MEVPTATPAPSTPAVLSSLTSAPIPPAKTPPTPPEIPVHAAPAASHAPTASPTSALPASSAPPAHIIQTVPPAMKQVPMPPAATVTAAETALPAPTTTVTVVDPTQDVTADTTVEHSAPTPALVDTEVEAKLTAEITKLWSVQKDGKATVRRTRTELKALRLALAEKLHVMKAILVRTGRGGGWASYLRSQKLPLPTADRYVAEHQATLTPPAKKVLSEELSTPTVDEIRQLAQKILPKLCRVLTTQELVFEFIHELVWIIDVAEAWETEKGLEIPKVESDDATEVDAQVADSADPAPAVP
jgi:hypothetical protein